MLSACVHRRRTYEGRKGAPKGRKETVNDPRRTRELGLASVWSPRLRPPAEAASDEFWQRSHIPNGDEMGVLVFIVVTVLIFGVLGLVQKLVEGL
jgi:hypothetical protein